ncbi:MAG: hypothetical protein JWM10_935 [Myxococcaceae bacterium]|nr:hypothetical protein [Myxococcaceae bacterium]
MALALAAGAGCGARVAPPVPASTPAAGVAGLYWGRWPEVPEGMRVAVWLHEDGAVLRGSWDLPPWHGELAALREGAGYEGVWREEGTVAIQQSRERRVRLTRDPRDGAFRERSPEGEAVTLERAGAHTSRLRPGLWLGRWTGLPTGVAVETLLTPLGAGRWRATYRYQDREGSFDGDESATGLAIRWREVSPRDQIARGRGHLHRDLLGLRGTYGVEDSEAGTGLWTLEAWRAP